MEMPTRHPVSYDGPAPRVSHAYRFRRPEAADGAAVHDLIARCPPLDTNSLYCNLLQCTHFAGTCVTAEAANKPGGLVGWVSGYVQPESPDCLFIWQVAVAPEARGTGLGRGMIREILGRDTCRDVTRIETTITDANMASWSLFQRLADGLGARLTRRAGFDAERHFAGRNPTEHLVDIGPFCRGFSGG